jgi:hypothetical protein
MPVSIKYQKAFTTDPVYHAAVTRLMDAVIQRAKEKRMSELFDDVVNFVGDYETFLREENVRLIAEVTRLRELV